MAHSDDIDIFIVLLDVLVLVLASNWLTVLVGKEVADWEKGNVEVVVGLEVLEMLSVCGGVMVAVLEEASVKLAVRVAEPETLALVDRLIALEIDGVREAV